MSIEEDRLKKLKKIRELKINPYPARLKRTQEIINIRKNFDVLVKEKKEVVLVGRLRSIRTHGKISFADIEDGTGKLQICFREDIVGKENYKRFSDLIDVGDFLQIEGELFQTKRGEKTLLAKKYILLTKSLLSLPEKWHGLANVETRFRKRYLDLISNPKVKEIFKKRSLIIRLIREFFNQRAFIEVETPILQPISGGANAQPFITHHNALDIDLYLRIAPELYLKRLIVGGFEKVYEIARCFRNEGIDREHNPEFTQIEFYQAYADYNDLMKSTEALMKFLLENLGEKDSVQYQNEKINFKPPYPRKDFKNILLKETGIDIDQEKNLKELIEKARNLRVEIDDKWGRGKVIDEIYKKLVRPKIIQPTFLINHPIELSPLAKQIPDRPGYVERFQLIIAGTEICNAFSELNDPVEQEKRFNQEQKLANKGDKEAQKLDQDFIEALKYGMPPTAGEGIGIDRLTLILTNTYNIREVILFPTLRPK